MAKNKTDRKVWAIYSLTPCKEGDYCRYVESFEVYEDAVLVFRALQKVNIMFNCYKVINTPLRCLRNFTWVKGQDVNLCFDDGVVADERSFLYRIIQYFKKVR